MFIQKLKNEKKRKVDMKWKRYDSIHVGSFFGYSVADTDEFSLYFHFFRETKLIASYSWIAHTRNNIRINYIDKDMLMIWTLLDIPEITE